MKAEVYTKTVCPHCVRAKGVLKNRNIEYVEIDAPSNMEAMIERVTTASGLPPRTVPQIFLDGEYIGGADDLEAHFKKVDLSNDLGGFEL
jgi:glutaredoxin 3